MPADNGVRLDDGQVASPIRENPGENGPKCPIEWPESRSLGVSLQNVELVAKGDVLKEELPTGSEGNCKCEKDDFEHPIML